ncbi:hypothetical protein DPMN_038204 [Dreissena polymorpha]|uniref:Uncharacterized protein n=1 Tax=Dreissena polymorpha TaxID=45954 RepID=A0A9D4MGI3_DREPO|nr:hypothetical protein DPMN_038204 [Dreissena polymorpha]
MILFNAFKSVTQADALQRRPEYSDEEAPRERSLSATKETGFHFKVNLKYYESKEKAFHLNERLDCLRSE